MAPLWKLLIIYSTVDVAPLEYEIVALSSWLLDVRNVTKLLETGDISMAVISLSG